MIEITEHGPSDSAVLDLDLDIEIKPVKFPQELTPLLRRRDVFLATLGFKNGHWEMLYMSPPYR